ncbi:LysR substrate-binding domain-containing protein [Tistrella bauzanensis]|uniref:LysR substrate-binding domain-containing protein n=1 Tax=Tistrella TaxID=171436 RepID=UPI0031F63F48
MTLTELKYLVAIADHGHFGRAASAAGVSQPTLSAQLRKLEDYLGVELVERSRKGVRLTAAGERVVGHARRALAEQQAILRLTRHRAKPLEGPYRLGAIPTLSPYLLPALLPVLKAAHGGLDLVVIEDLTDHLLALLDDGRLDAALVALPVEMRGRQAMALFDEGFLAVVPQAADMAAGADSPIDAAELAATRLLVLADGHCLRDQVLAACARTAASGDDFRAASLETLRELVAAGFGTTLVPALAAAAWRRSGETRLRFRPVIGPAGHRRIALVWRRGAGDADALALARVCRQAIPDVVQAVDDDTPPAEPGRAPESGGATRFGAKIAIDN